ncbi:MAG: hypothetical protein LBT71_06025 [Azoarcus sp.]|jgi:hypothetical protein|nr:hypothetical protein [Azoarcus sp.]
MALSSASVFAQQPPGSAAPAGASSQQAQRPPGGGIGRETSFTAIAPGKWTGPRLNDGQPDVSGHWSNTIANHNNFTDPQGGIINDPSPRAQKPQGPREARAPSRVSDPADGQVPFQPWAAAKVKDFQAHFNDPVKPEYIEPLARCAPSGIPKSFYWHGYEIRQYPGYLLIMFNSGYRLIHLDGKPHLPKALKLWNGDSRGHWEGNTLVVSARNLNGKALFGRSGEFFSENATVDERYIFSNDGTRYNYVAVVTDPTVFTRPFSITIPARRYTEKDTPNGWHYEANPANYDGKALLHERSERICHENNGGFGSPAIIK